MGTIHDHLIQVVRVSGHQKAKKASKEGRKEGRKRQQRHTRRNTKHKELCLHYTIRLPTSWSEFGYLPSWRSGSPFGTFFFISQDQRGFNHDLSWMHGCMDNVLEFFVYFALISVEVSDVVSSKDTSFPLKEPVEYHQH